MSWRHNTITNMELRQDRNKKLAILALLGFGIVAGLMALKYGLDNRSRAELLACVGQTSVTCIVKPNGDTNLDDFTYDVKVENQTSGLNIVPSDQKMVNPEGTNNSDGSKSFNITFEAGAGNYVCRVTATPRDGSYCEGVDASKTSLPKSCQPPTNNDGPIPTIPTDAGGGGTGDGGGVGNETKCLSCEENGKLGIFTTFEGGTGSGGNPQTDGVTRKYVYWTAPANPQNSCQPDKKFCDQVLVYSDDSPDNPVHTFACVYCTEPGLGVTDPTKLICQDNDGKSVTPPFYTQHQAKNTGQRDYVVKFKDKTGKIWDSSMDKFCGYEDSYGCPSGDQRLSCELQKPPTQPACEPGCDFSIDQGSVDSCNIPNKRINFKIASNVPNGDELTVNFNDDDNTNDLTIVDRNTVFKTYDDSGAYDVKLTCRGDNYTNTCVKRLVIGCKPDSGDPTPPPSETPTPMSCELPQPTLIMPKCKNCAPTPTCGELGCPQ